jgi:hypothetical protein
MESNKKNFTRMQFMANGRISQDKGQASTDNSIERVNFGVSGPGTDYQLNKIFGTQP